MTFFQGLHVLLLVVCILIIVSIIVDILYHELCPRSTEEFR